MSKPIRIIALGKPTAKKPVPEYDPRNIDSIVNIVHAAREKKNQAENQRAKKMLNETRRQLHHSKRNEAAMQYRLNEANRTIRILSGRRPGGMTFRDVANIAIDMILIGFSLFGMIAAARMVVSML